jgi:hemolysin D
MQQEVLVQKSRYQEADAAVAALTQTRAQATAEYRRIRFDKLSKAEQKVTGLAQDLIKAQQRTKLQALTAPVDGVVQQLAVHTVGGVVSPGQVLLAVVPLDSHLRNDLISACLDVARLPSGNRSDGFKPRNRFCARQSGG